MVLPRSLADNAPLQLQLPTGLRRPDEEEHPANAFRAAVAQTWTWMEEEEVAARRSSRIGTVPMPEHVDEALRAVAKRETCWRERSRSMV